MNLPIGKLFYFVPNIQSYTDASLATNGQTGIHYPPYGAPNMEAGQTPNSGYDYNNTKDLYDRFYEGNEPALDPPGLYDYSKGQYSAITAPVATVAWVGDQLVASGYGLSDYRKVLIVMSGFASDGAGKLIGPDGQPMDNESFLADLRILGVAGNPYTSDNVNNNYLLRDMVKVLLNTVTTTQL
jgi:hypothetical protein